MHWASSTLVTRAIRDRTPARRALSCESTIADVTDNVLTFSLAWSPDECIGTAPLGLNSRQEERREPERGLRIGGQRPINSRDG
jgi:hypothetical protein